NLIVALAASRSATAERAQISGRRRKSIANSQRSTPPAAHSLAAPPSANSLNRLNSNHSHHPRHSNPHSPRRATLVPLPRFPPLEVCGRRPRVRSATVMGPASENLHRSSQLGNFPEADALSIAGDVNLALPKAHCAPTVGVTVAR